MPIQVRISSLSQQEQLEAINEVKVMQVGNCSYKHALRAPMPGAGAARVWHHRCARCADEQY